VSLSSFATAILIPPLNFISWGAAGLVLAVTPTPLRHLGRLAAGLALTGLIIASLPATASLLINSLEAGLPHMIAPQQGGQPGAIVILGGDGAYGAPGGIEPGSDIGALSLERVRAGALLARRTGLPLLTTGDSLEPHAIPIGQLMATSLHDDFATQARWVEPDAVDTWENARLSAAILRQAGIDQAYVVTDAWHMKRALIAFRRAGITATPAPVRFDRPLEFDSNALTPHISALADCTYAVHEWIGIAYYLLRP
jgi:uncharacterized SAM-binding protein YcdF (DUF218 family)